ncbi:unnamed protein product, partial [Iphiclides podalirius]
MFSISKGGQNAKRHSPPLATARETCRFELVASGPCPYELDKGLLSPMDAESKPHTALARRAFATRFCGRNSNVQLKRNDGTVAVNNTLHCHRSINHTAPHRHRWSDGRKSPSSRAATGEKKKFPKLFGCRGVTGATHVRRMATLSRE